MIFLLAAALALAGPGAEQLFGDWVVTCDNVKRCEATALMPERWQGEQAPGMDVAREAGPGGAVTVVLTPVTQAGGIIDVLIDRRLVGSGVMRGGSIRLTGGTAEGLVRAMASGHQLTLRSGRRTLATLSLNGSSAALRYIDVQQGRAGGVTALVARGGRPAAAVPAAAALPRVPAVRPGAGKAATLSRGQTEPLRKQAGCDDFSVSSELKPEYYRLDGRSTLVTIPCVSGAYQSSLALFVLTDGRIAPAPFDFPPPTNGTDPVPWLTEPEWDARTGTLSSHAKGRGLGDCGVNQSWVWDGTRFRMTLYNGLDTCRLSGGWPTRYRAQPSYRK
jgi:hypothetical protein